MADSPNVAAVRRFVDAFNRLDFESVRAYADPDLELHEWPQAPGARTFRGWDDVQRGIAAWFEAWEWMSIEIVDLEEFGDRVLVSLDQRAKGKGSEIELELRSFNVYSFRDGTIIRIELFTERDPALEAARLTPDYQEEKR